MAETEPKSHIDPTVLHFGSCAVAPVVKIESKGIYDPESANNILLEHILNERAEAMKYAGQGDGQRV